MIISQVVDYFNLKNFPNANILKTKDIVQSMPFCIYYRKNSCLTRPINQQLIQFQSGGLIQSWSKKFQKPPYLKDKSHMEPTALSFDQISGLVTVCIVATVISIMVFILELMSTSHESIKILLDFLTFKAKTKYYRRVNKPNKPLKLISLNGS